MITFACPHCTRVLRVREEFAGRQGKCPHCQQALRAPTPSAVKAAPIVAMVVEDEPDAHPTPLDVQGRGVAGEGAAATPPPGPDSAGSDTAALTTQMQSGPSSTTEPAPRPVSVPGYEILCELGRGGMGVVYRAKQTDLNRLVALKMILAGQFAAPELRARFQHEAKAVAKLQHPNIVQVYATGEHEGTPFFALEYVDGGSLSDALHSRIMPVRQAAQLMTTLAEAVEHAHQNGIIHRDLKPGNILLSPDGDPKITDFGLAKELDSESAHTKSGAIMGTPSYMAPEQADGQSRGTGPHTDIYALGAILYEMLTGRPPFKGATPLDTVMEVLEKPPLPPRKLQPHIPADLETICLKCLAKDPHRRYPSAQAMAEDLQRFLAHEPIRARRVGLGERAIVWARKRPAFAALLVVSVVAAAAVTAAWYVLHSNQKLQAALDEADSQRRIATQALTSQQTEREAKEAAQRDNLYFHRIALAERELLANQTGRANALLDECPANMRGWEWHYLRRLCHPELLACLEHKGGVTGVAFSPDGQRLVSGGEDQTVRIWDATTGQNPMTFKGHKSWVRAVAYSPNGLFVASASDDGTAKVWDAATGAEKTTFLGHKGATVYSVAFSPDSKRIASASADGAARIWDVETGKELRAFSGHDGFVLAVAFDRSGRVLATAGVDKTIRLWDLDSGKELRQLRGHTKEVTAVAFSQDGQRLASASGDQTARLWDVASGQETLTLAGHAGPVHGVAFSPDGRRVATAGAAVRVWDSTSGTELFTLRGHTGDVLAVAFSPDGRRLVSTSEDGAVKIWDGQARPGTLSITAHDAEINCLAFSPDGRWLASGSEDHLVKIWETATGKLVRTFDQHTTEVRCVAFSPDGRRIASLSRDSLLIWEPPTGKVVVNPNIPSTYAAFSPDGKRLAISTIGLQSLPTPSMVILLLDAETGASTGQTLAGHQDFITWFGFNRSGDLLASVERNSPLLIWDMKTSKVQQRIDAAAVDSRVNAAIAPDGKRAACTFSGQGFPNEVQLFDLTNTLAAPAHCQGHLGEIYGVAFSPDSQRLATSGTDKMVKLWSTPTGQEILTLTGHTDWVMQTAFSPDGHWLATAGRDRTIRLWDGRPLPNAGK